MKKFNVNDIENELKRETYKSKYNRILRSTVYGLIIVAAFTTIIASLLMPVVEISGTSMAPILNDGEIVVSVKTKNIKKGDIIAFYHGNKILIKRVIASPSDWVYIDDEGNVSVNGEVINESYVQNKMLGETDVEFPLQVQDGKWFVLSDKRDTIIDSRNSEVGCISNDDIIGKIIFRVWPIKNIGSVN